MILEAWIGVVVSANLALSVHNARSVGEDSVARNLARSAHSRIDDYVATDGGEGP